MFRVSFFKSLCIFWSPHWVHDWTDFKTAPCVWFGSGQDHAVLGCTWTVILHRKLFDLLQKLLSRVVEVGTDSQRELFFRFEAGLIAHVLTVSCVGSVGRKAGCKNLAAFECWRQAILCHGHSRTLRSLCTIPNHSLTLSVMSVQ